jgi:hypothetical protein
MTAPAAIEVIVKGIRAVGIAVPLGSSTGFGARSVIVTVACGRTCAMAAGTAWVSICATVGLASEAV